MDKKVFRDILLLLGVIVIAAIGARILAGGETLSDYARNNPGASESSSDSSGPAASILPYVQDYTTSTAIPVNSASIISVEEGNAISSENINPERVIYADGFYYEPISDEVFNRISGISYPADCPVPIDELSYVSVRYVDFDGETQKGELICNKALAQDLVEIFSELYKNDYRLESVKLVDEFDGDDEASMTANNTSCFNYRTIPGSSRISNHAKGRAIDINPFYNPYITYKDDGSTNISPKGSDPYADRSADFPYKIDENDLAYKLFIEHGFSWGGNWNSSKDYQHFEKKE